MTEEQRMMKGLAECPHCGEELEAPLVAAYRQAKCPSCSQKFMLPSAQAMFNNAALYLMTHEVERNVNDEMSVEELQFEARSDELSSVDWTSRRRGRNYRQAM
ncbi:hypothetical protein [Algisphaera agarilytica]|uniref:DNA-directed RNA polymerase subunit RPC12/RpoP n=1 Tax=Algisphaera agarilytica TaxID=1385975 RepID=A0A7X0H498_9BACT|nr:hypothetical protein [Algisphaera agarilytica]MBB6428782.1 DNA-directed RNA polymerase subunit RPC12/RpoP [Algisphaera agarilytica]